MNNDKMTYKVDGKEVIGDRVDVILNGIYGKVDYLTYENVRYELMKLIGKEEED